MSIHLKIVQFKEEKKKRTSGTLKNLKAKDWQKYYSNDDITTLT